MTIFYHGDMDGIAAASIYLHKDSYNSEVKVRFFEFEYDKQDFIRTILYGNATEDVIFVDCCPDKDIILYLVKTVNVRTLVILDHHQTTKPIIDSFIDEGLIQGLSYIGASATLITWCWFEFKKDKETIINFLDRTKSNRALQEEKLPLSIRLINSWDIWNKMYIDAEPYKTYFETRNYTPEKKEVYTLITNEVEVRKAIAEGNYMVQFFHQWGKQYCEKFGYEVKYLNYDFFVLNVGNANSKIFGNLIYRYDAVIIYCNDGTRYKCSIYTYKKDFDCSAFAEKFGGGGHRKAAGFTLPDIPPWLKNKKSKLLLGGKNENTD